MCEPDSRPITGRSNRPSGHLHVRLRGGQTISLTIPIPPTGWKARQSDPATFALLDQLLDDHTDAEVAEALNAAGHRSGEGKAFTRLIVLDRKIADGKTNKEAFRALKRRISDAVYRQLCADTGC